MFRFWNSISSWGFGSKVIKCGAGSSLSTSSGSKEGVIEGTQTFDLDLFIYGWRVFLYQECVGEPGKTDWIESRCLCLFFIDRIPIIFSLRRRRQGRGTEHGFAPQPPSVISNLNPLFLFTSTLRATTSNPLTSKGKR